MIEVRSVKNESEFNDMLYQRWLVLRAPLGMPRGTEKDLYEDSAFHVVALWESQIIGSARLRALSKELGSIAYVAVLTEFQNQGIGTRLVEKLIEVAAEQNLPTLRVMTRTSALKFYQRLGFVAEGEPFDYLEIPHVFMYRRLQAGFELLKD
jgi:ribosomal protein S18 acetylase RimI-like enzyme